MREVLETEFKACRRRLWEMAYRLTGTVADADDVLQETFIRALASPPPDTTAPWLPWLIRVAMNVGRDLLRKRKTRGYEGSWLPSPIETSDEEDEVLGPEQRYGLVESASYAFLLALETLTPTVRAIVVLRDVFDLSVAETAAALELTEANVRVAHHRARKAMGGYDRERRPSSPAAQRAAQELFGRFLMAVNAGDLDGVRALLATDVRSLADANGEFIAAAQAVEGQDRVARFMLGLASLGIGLEHLRLTMINGMPALLMAFNEERRARDAPRTVLRCEVAGGVITRLDWVMATGKLAHLSFTRASIAAT